MVVSGEKQSTAEVIDAIELYDFCRTFRQLPQPGGVLDQDSYYVWLLNIVKRAFDERERIELERQKNESKRRR